MTPVGIVGIEEWVAGKLHEARFVVFVAEDGINSIRAATGEELAKVAFDAMEEYLGHRPGVITTNETTEHGKST